jgi:hypothetical protein
LATTNYVLTTATNVAAALTNQLAIPTTNQFITLQGATNVAAALTNQLSFDVAGAALNATNAFASGELNTATNNTLATATNIATAFTNNFGTTIPVNMTNSANSFTGGVVIPTNSILYFGSTTSGTYMTFDGTNLLIVVSGVTNQILSNQ